MHDEPRAHPESLYLLENLPLDTDRRGVDRFGADIRNHEVEAGLLEELDDASGIGEGRFLEAFAPGGDFLEAALDYLFQRGSFADPARAPRPDLVLLDLNLPRLPGKQVLEAVRADPKLRCIPVVVLTTSARQRDIQESYTLGCNAYVVKPLEARQFFQMFRSLCSHWFDVVVLPED